MTRSRAAEAAADRLRPVFIAAALLLIALLAFFAYSLAHGQNQQRKDLDRRFNDRAKVAAIVNESLFGLSNTSVRQADSQRFGGPTVDKTFLAQRAQANQSSYSAIYSADGKVLAATGNAPDDLTQTDEF